MKPFSWTLLGYGDLAERRVAAALGTSLHGRLSSIWGRDSARARAFAQRHGIPTSHGSLEEALANESEGVYICTPADSHFEYARAAIRAGKHVLVEKPLTIDACQSAELVNEARARGVTLGVAYYRRAVPKMQKIREWIQSGLLGTPTFVNIVAHSWFSPEANDPKHWRVEKRRSGGGGALCDIGVHRLDLLDFWLGESSVAWADLQHLVHAYEVEDGCSAALKLKNGAPVHAYFAWNSKTWIDRFEIVGTEAKIIAEPLDGSCLTLIRGRDREELSLEAPANPYLPLVDDFIGAVRECRSPLCDGASALRTDLLTGQILRLGSLSEPGSLL